MRKYNLNETFFNIIDSEIKAYLLGFLFADGYINEKNNVIEITIHEKDKEILDMFVNYLYPNGRPLKVIKNNYLRLVINSKIIVNDLSKLGCMQAKTFKIKYPVIPSKYDNDFIRGYFDGDGCVTITRNSLTVSFVGTIELLNSINVILLNNCNLNETKYDKRYSDRENNIRTLIFGGNIIVNRIFHYLYDDSNFYLFRKKEKFISILESKFYFNNKNFSRKAHQKYYTYNGGIYNKSELATLLSDMVDSNSNTIRSKLTKGWSIDEIINLKINARRLSKRKKIIRIDANGNEEYYDSVEIAAKINNCAIGSIYQAILQNRKLKKYKWKYYE